MIGTALAARNPDQNIEWHLRTFHAFAQYFKRFLSGTTDGREGLFFERVDALETMTVFPFLLGLYEATEDDSERIPILEDLESFLVRRMVCRLTTQGYTRLFLEMVAELSKDGGYTRGGVRGFLLRQTAESGKWPNDEEFLASWLETPLYRAVTRGRLRLLLRALDSALHDKKTEKYELQHGLTVEHILPQYWEAYWALPPKEGEEPEKYVERKQRRDHLLHTIGNLTLLTQSLNTGASNGPFARKKAEILKHTILNLSKFLHDVDDWDEDGIRQRGKDLFKVAKRIWAYPAEVEAQQAEDD